MQFLDLTLQEPAANLALDEALLLEAEEADEPREVLRLWESRVPMIVVGSSSRIRDEVNEDEAQQRQIPIFRRASGGLTIVTGPGCLMYSVVLSYKLRPELRSLDQAHQFVLGSIASALNTRIAGVEQHGISDLTVGMKKFSGNAVRCKRENFLYHGTLLYDFPLDVISACLRTPPRQPKYRKNRHHESFVTNLSISRGEMHGAMTQAFEPLEPSTAWPERETARLVEEKYSRREWNYRS